MRKRIHVVDLPLCPSCPLWLPLFFARHLSHKEPKDKKNLTERRNEPRITYEPRQSERASDLHFRGITWPSVEILSFYSFDSPGIDFSPETNCHPGKSAAAWLLTIARASSRVASKPAGSGFSLTRRMI